jgi:superfamily II DNA or RNA helicase
VPSKHKDAPSFIRRKFFEGLRSFADFEARTGELSNTKEVGDAFEILVEAYLHLNPVLKAKDVWLVGDVPSRIRTRLNLPAGTKGIDGVFEDTDGNLVPYQAKYRTDKTVLSYTEVSSFLGVTEESLKDRVIFTNARELAADITKRKGLRSVRAAQFHNLEEEDFRRINAWLSDKKPEFKRWSPLPHQKEAVEQITVELEKASRTTAVMACGTGKTLVALWAAEAMNPKTVLVLVPSLALLSQTLPDWCKQSKWGSRFRYLCVCSDASVDQSAKNDDYALNQSDLEFTVTTEAKQVEDFLAENRTGVNVIFSTYQSVEVVAAGLKGAAVDFAIFDEAHKTTGPKEGLFAYGLSDEKILIKKRLFLTATPRHYDLRKRDKDGDFITVSMSDESVYGKVSYRLSFSAAVAAKIIVPYKVIISVSLNKDLDDEMLRTGSTLVRRNEIQAKWVANQIALKRAIKKTAASKIITFHSRVKLAEEFASDGARGFSEHVKGFDVFHVNGGQSAASRKVTLEDFKLAKRGLITNARCLTEGVDVPSVDMVAFVDPRKSKIDIAQAAGRAMRQSKATNKKLGYIVVPLFIEQKKNETEAEALARSGFDEVAIVLGAMLENDDDLVDLIREMKEAKGRGDKFNPKSLHEKIEVIGPAIDLDELRRSIDVEIVDRLGMGWDEWYGLLQRFHKREGHCRVQRGKEEHGLDLGSWVITQRYKKDRLTVEQLKRLNALGFSWDPFAEQWEEGFAALKTFHEREGHCRVPIGHEAEGLNLGRWVSKQRTKRDSLSPDQLKRLNALAFGWDPFSEQWEEGFAALEKFRKREGDCNVHPKHTENGLKLGGWVVRQRQEKESLSTNQVVRLDRLGFCWDRRAELWEQGFAALRKFHQRKGHCHVAQGLVVEGLNLGAWVRTQRGNKDSLTPSRLKRLNSLGFTWDPRAEQWEKRFAALKKFHKREGHCVVPRGKDEDGLDIGNWLNAQRGNKDSLTPSQLKRLNSLGFTWDPRAEQWEKRFAALKKFHKREGHFVVPRGKNEDGLDIGNWSIAQRRNKDSLTPNQLKRLNSLGFTWDPFAEQWEERFAALEKFKQREGHCRVAKKHQEEELNLGAWVMNQRSKKDTLTPERIARLDRIGFSWDPRADYWETNFAALEKFKQRVGHCCPSQKHQEGVLKLGSWVTTQRARRDTLSPERIARLNALGFVWKT